MAHLIRINPPRSASEARAQRQLSKTLPSSWILTTNINENNFKAVRSLARKRKPEIDSALMCPLGIFILDLKNFAGLITPYVNKPWGGTEDRGNPFTQSQDNLYPVKELLSSHDARLKTIWFEYLIVLTNKNVILNWQALDEVSPLRWHVALIDDVEEHVRKIAALSDNVRPLNSVRALEALRAFDPEELPEGLFDHWNDKRVSGLAGRAKLIVRKIAPRAALDSETVAADDPGAPNAFETPAVSVSDLSPYEVQLSIEETAVPIPPSPDAYEPLDPAHTESPMIGETFPGGRTLSRAHSVFAEQYFGSGRPLITAYREAVEGLSGQDLNEFDDSLYRLAIPPDVLTSTINEVWRTECRPQSVRPKSRTRPRIRRQDKGAPSTYNSPFGPGWELEP